MNKIQIVGRFVKDPELSNTPNGTTVVRFNIASKSKLSEKNGDPKTDFFSCIAWKNLAETIAKYCKKGDLTVLSGTLSSRTYEKDGNKNIIWEVNVEDLEFCTTRAEREQQGVPTAPREDLKPLDEPDDPLPF